VRSQGGSEEGGGTHLPEENEVLEHGEGDVNAVEKSVAEKEDEELVVGEVDAVVDLLRGKIN
jgi:hypothetical protein